jgi:CHAT domain/Effector-associated domain 10
MTTNAEQSSKFNINIGQVTGGDIHVGDRTYHAPSPQPPTPSSSSKRTILFLASSPVNQARLRLDIELREIDHGLRLGQHREQFELKQRWAVRPDDLRRSLLDDQPQILHFSGHGEGNDGLILENQQGQAQAVPTQALANLFALFASRGLECVILNACYSEVQASAIAQHIPYVIGMNAAIGDKAAIQFAIGFYDALGAGWTYADAYHMGCNAIALEGIAQASIPVLKTQP